MYVPNPDHPGQHPFDRWWNIKDDDKAANAVFGTAQWLYSEQRSKRTMYLHYLRMYSNRLASALSGKDFYNSSAQGNYIRINLTKSCVDAAIAQLASENPSVMFHTKDAPVKVRKKAVGMGRFVDGVFFANEQTEAFQHVFRDAAIFGNGYQRIYSEGTDVKIERVLPWELLYDHVDAFYGTPSVLYRTKQVERELLIALYPKDRRIIEDAGTFTDEETWGDTSLSDPVTVIEAWKLPSTKDADDGASILCVSSGALARAPWKRERFPVVGWQWNTQPFGIDGIGIVEELIPIQIEINYLAQKIQRLMTLATTVGFVHKGSGIKQVTNKDLSFYEYQGQPPIFHAIAAVHAEYFMHLERLYQKGFEIIGISQLMAQSKKPAGLDSGEALRTHYDIGTRRFKHVGKRIGVYHVRLARVIMDEARAMVERGVSPKSLAKGDAGVELVDFRDVDLEDNTFMVQPKPVPLLPDDPAGQIQTFQTLVQAVPSFEKYIPMMMGDIPDLKRIASLENAPFEQAELYIENILEGRAYQAPHPMMNLMLARDLAQKQLLRAEIEGLSSDVLDGLYRFIEDIDNMQAMGQNVPVSQGSSGPVSPEGVPVPPIGPGAPLGMPGPMPNMNPPGVMPGLPGIPT